MKGSVTFHARHPRKAYTMVELMVSIAASSMLMVGMASTMYISFRMVDPDTSVDVVLDASETTLTLTDELRYAIYITERSTTMIQFVVPDRTGDSINDVIRYEWSGTAGDELMRAFNHGTAESAVEDVHAFALTYDTQTTTESIPTEKEDPERLLIEYMGASLLADWDVLPTDWIGQYFHPSDFSPALPSNAISWRVTKVELMAMQGGNSDGTAAVELRPATGSKTPTSTVLEAVRMTEANLSTSFQLETFAFSNNGNHLPNQGLCFVIKFEAGTDEAARIEYDEYDLKGRVLTFDSGAIWTVAPNDDSLRYKVHGRVTVPDTPLTISRNYLTGVGISILSGEDTNAQLDTRVQLINSPELLSAYWELDFNSNPLQVDLNGDDTYDFKSQGAPFDPSTVSGGVWHSSPSPWVFLDGRQQSNLTKPITVQLRSRARTVNPSGGAVLFLSVDATSGSHAALSVILSLQNDGTQVAAVFTFDQSFQPVELVSVKDLSDEFIRFRLVIDPSRDMVAVWIEDAFQGTFRYIVRSQSFFPLVQLLPLHSDSEFEYCSVRAIE